MNELKVINQQEVLGKHFRIYGTIENPLFLAKDVAEWIEHNKPSEMILNVDDDEKLKAIISHSGQRREMWFLTEDGFYEVLMQSRKPIAKQFKKEVKKILKDIRKNGMYATDELLDNPDLLIAAATKLKEERAARLKAEEEKERLQLESKQKDQIIGELKPKADYTDVILKSKSLVTTTQIAKDYGMSGRDFNKKLHELKVQYKQNEQWLLYSKYHDKGYTHSETITITRSNGIKDTKMNTKWTQKGRLFLYDLLKENGILPMIEREDM